MAHATSKPVHQLPSPLERAALILWKFHQMNLVLIHAGKLAEVKGFEFETRRLGREIDRSHTDVDEKIMAMIRAQALRLDEPAEVPDFYANQIAAAKQALKRLSDLPQKDFDKEFISEMKRIHRHLTDELEREASMLSSSEIDSPVARLTQSLLPRLNRLFESAKQVEKNR